MGKARNDLEYERFTTGSDGQTAVRVVDSSNLAELQTLNSLVPSKYDYVALAYNGSSLLTSATFKLGGSTGSTVSTINLSYSGSDLISVQKV